MYVYVYGDLIIRNFVLMNTKYNFLIKARYVTPINAHQTTLTGCFARSGMYSMIASLIVHFMSSASSTIAGRRL